MACNPGSGGGRFGHTHHPLLECAFRRAIWNRGAKIEINPPCCTSQIREGSNQIHHLLYLPTELQEIASKRLVPRQSFYLPFFYEILKSPRSSSGHYSRWL